MSTKKPKSNRWHPSDESDDLIFAVCDRFFKQLGKTYQSVATHSDDGESEEKRGAAAAVAAWLKEEWGRTDLTREKVYPLFWEASRRGFLLLQAPPEKQLADRVREKFGLQPHNGQLTVVNVRGESAALHVTSRAADLIVDLIERVSREKNAKLPKGSPPASVHLGMGAGFAAMLVAKRLAQKVNTDGDCPPLVLHSLTGGGFLVNEPQKSPTTYMSYFDQTVAKVSYVALFTETVVDNSDYERHKMNPGIRLPFERRDEIDIVVTSLAAADHEHGLLGSYLSHLAEQKLLDKNLRQEMRDAGWVGDVQFRPYSADGPLENVCPVRAVTLFELDELVKLAKSGNKYVVLVAGPCGECGTPKAQALKPLLANDKLRLWSHLVTDAGTATELLDNNQ